jgi:hypothetical protein
MGAADTQRDPSRKVAFFPNEHPGDGLKAHSESAK